MQLTLPSFYLCQAPVPKLDGLRGRLPGCTWDSLRNSVGEKILHLRSQPLGALSPGYCGLLQELSEEQSFAISYLDIGEVSPLHPPSPNPRTLSSLPPTPSGLCLHPCP